MRLLAALALLISLVTAAVAGNMIATDLEFTRLETEISFWGRGDYVPAELTRSRMDREVMAFASDHPQLADARRLLASQLAWEAYWAENPGDRAALASEAVASQLRLLILRPASRQGWENLLEYSRFLAEPDEAVLLARRQLAGLPRWQ